jgi:cytochrome c
LIWINIARLESHDGRATDPTARVIINCECGERQSTGGEIVIMRNVIVVAIAAAAVLVAPTAWAQATGNADAGKTVFLQCKGCHSLEPGKNGIGPSLHGLFGRKAGTEAGYNYSPAMKSSGVTWNDDTLFIYLANPKAFVPGDKMPFPGLPDEQKRHDVIAYLKEATK